MYWYLFIDKPEDCKKTGYVGYKTVNLLKNWERATTKRLTITKGSMEIHKEYIDVFASQMFG